MSIYNPDPAYLRSEYSANGWYVMDKFGILDGPYATASDAHAVIENYRRAWAGEAVN